MARLLGGVADAGAGLDRALPLDRAGARQDGFEQGRLAGWKGPTSAMHRGPWALVPPLPFAAAIDASLWRRTAGWFRPQVLTPEGHRLRGMWRWQEEQGRPIVSGGRVSRARSAGSFGRLSAKAGITSRAKRRNCAVPPKIVRMRYSTPAACSASSLAQISSGRAEERVGFGTLRGRRIGQDVRASLAVRRARRPRRSAWSTPPASPARLPRRRDRWRHRPDGRRRSAPVRESREPCARRDRARCVGRAHRATHTGRG